jgi:tetratricopeptide (TPR) repeat protein
MHYERDAIQHLVAPQVNEVAQRYGQTISFCDLRWGIDTQGYDSTTASRKVLDVCLDEIDRSDPPMVVLLGYRYGWTPTLDDPDLPGETREQAQRRKADPLLQASRRKRMQLDDLEISVTELEVRYGGLESSGREMPFVCYFREIDPALGVPESYLPEDDAHYVRLNQLKQRIARVAGRQLRTYRVRPDQNGSLQDSMSDFATMMAEDVINFLKPKWQEFFSLTPYQRTIAAHERAMDRCADMLSVNHDVADEAIELLAQRGGTTLLLYGAGGVGKSTVASYVARELSYVNGIHVLYLSCGTTSNTTTANGVLKLEVQFLKTILGMDTEDAGVPVTSNNSVPRDYARDLDELCMELDRKHRRAVIVIDALDQLADANNTNVSIVLPRTGHPSLSVLATCIYDQSVEAYHYELEPLKTDEEVLDVLRTLERRHSHALPAAARQAILRKSLSRNPLYVNLIYQRLLMMHRPDFEHINAQGGTMDAIASHAAQTVESCPDDMHDMIDHLFESAGALINPELTGQVIDAIASTRFGIRPSVLAAIYPETWSPVDFSHLVNYLSDSFIVREDGRYDFAHRIIREQYLRAPGLLTYAQNRIVKHLNSLPENDPGRINEIVYHFMMADDHKRFAEYIKHWQPVEDRRPIEAAAACAYQQILQDKGEWITDFLNRSGPLLSRMARLVIDTSELDNSIEIPDPSLSVQEDDWRIVWFICYELAYMFGPSKQEQELLLRLLTRTLSFAKETTKKFFTPDTVYMVAATVLKQSQTILRLQGVEYNPALGAKYLDEDSEKDRLEECELALDSLNWAIRFMEHLVKDIETDNCWSLLGYLYLWKSRTLYALGRINKADAAVSQSIEVWEMLLEHVSTPAYKEALATALSDRGRMLLSQEDPESIALAPKLYAKAISHMGDPSHLSGTDLYDYLIVCSTASIALANTGDARNVNKAITLSRANLRRAEKQYHETGSYSFLVSLHEALYAHAFALQATGDTQAIRDSIAVFQRAVDCAAEAIALSDSAEARMKYLQTSESLVLVLRSLGTPRDLALASKVIRERRSIAG